MAFSSLVSVRVRRLPVALLAVSLAGVSLSDVSRAAGDDRGAPTTEGPAEELSTGRYIVDGGAVAVAAVAGRKAIANAQRADSRTSYPDRPLRSVLKFTDTVNRAYAAVTNGPVQNLDSKTAEAIATTRKLFLSNGDLNADLIGLTEEEKKGAWGWSLTLIKKARVVDVFMAELDFQAELEANPELVKALGPRGIETIERTLVANKVKARGELDVSEARAARSRYRGDITNRQFRDAMRYGNSELLNRVQSRRKAGGYGALAAGALTVFAANKANAGNATPDREAEAELDRGADGVEGGATAQQRGGLNARAWSANRDTRR